MIAFVVQFHDAFGHRDVRKVSRSSAGAEAYITSTLAAASATDIVWESNRTYCTALARIRGPQGGFELVSYSIEEHVIID
ncbi:MAG: hypothetical protein QG574_4376 [Cyanobacteriota bacterium erpe_2018_sw_21hr_WHONDRS-SW48-000092_B_bin.40]|jgi:hypothetical protein|nr:hypothetical protein [Cyanobacteriota bacterium erpe_2018_sw_21hr_WHONDRS-SW48-000092_B_bin.40]